MRTVHLKCARYCASVRLSVSLFGETVGDERISHARAFFCFLAHQIECRPAQQSWQAASWAKGEWRNVLKAAGFFFFLANEFLSINNDDVDDRRSTTRLRARLSRSHARPFAPVHIRATNVKQILLISDEKCRKVNPAHFQIIIWLT